MTMLCPLDELSLMHSGFDGRPQTEDGAHSSSVLRPPSYIELDRHKLVHELHDLAGLLGRPAPQPARRCHIDRLPACMLDRGENTGVLSQAQFLMDEAGDETRAGPEPNILQRLVVARVGGGRHGALGE